MHSSCKSDSDTLKLLSPPETVVPELQPRIDKPYQSCSTSRPSNVVSNSANIPQGHYELTESASCRRATSADIGNKGISVFRDPRVSRREHVRASDQQSPREPHPADPDRPPATTLAPVSSRTISGHGDTDGPGVDLVSRSRDGQASASAYHYRSVAKRLMSSSGSIKRIFFPRGPRKTHHQITADPSPMSSSTNAQQHPPGFPSPPPNVLDGRTPKNMGSDTASGVPGPEDLGGLNQNQDTSRLADPPGKRKFRAQQDNGMAPPGEHGPEHPSAKPTGLPHSPDVTTASAEPSSWHQPVAQQHHLDRGSCRVGENEGLDHEAKPVAGKPNPVEERELSATPEGPKTSREHLIEISSSTPHLEIDIPPLVSDVTPHLITPTSIPVERADSSHPSRRYEPSLTHLHHDATGGQGTSELLPDPSLSTGRMALSIGSRQQAHADAVTEVSASCNICNGPPAFSPYKLLRSYQRTPSEKGKIPVASYPDLGSSDEEGIANESEDDNFSEVFTDAHSGSYYNGPGSSKSASHNW